MDELHVLLTLLGLFVIYAFFHRVYIFISILTHHTIFDRFRIRDGVSLDLGLIEKLGPGHLRYVLLLLISYVVMLLLRSLRVLLGFEVVITDVIAVILSAQGKLLICLCADKMFLFFFLFLMLNLHFLLHLLVTRLRLYHFFLHHWRLGVRVETIALDFLD